MEKILFHNSPVNPLSNLLNLGPTSTLKPLLLCVSVLASAVCLGARGTCQGVIRGAFRATKGGVGGKRPDSYGYPAADAMGKIAHGETRGESDEVDSFIHYVRTGKEPIYGCLEISL